VFDRHEAFIGQRRAPHSAIIGIQAHWNAEPHKTRKRVIVKIGYVTEQFVTDQIYLNQVLVRAHGFHGLRIGKEVDRMTNALGAKEQSVTDAMIHWFVLFGKAEPRSLEIFTIGEKSENGGREHLFRETGLTIKTLWRTSLEKMDGGIFSKVDRVHLGGMPVQLAEEVATYFPPGFCIYGSGGDVGSI
jgi:hypothetical protein